MILVARGGSFPRALEHAARRGERLAGADLRGAALGSAFLFRANLAGADLQDADLAGAYLREADIHKADLGNARLQGAFMKGVDGRGADLRGANLARADLRDAILVGANLAGANLDRARLAGAILDWRSTAVAVELLRQDLGAHEGGSPIVLDLMFHDDGEPYSWLTRLLAQPSRRVRTQALTVLTRRVRRGDNAPQVLRRLAALIPASEAPAGSRGAA